MDELDLLKKDWNKHKEQRTLTASDIYKMLQKKSSSIVKTLFYISIAELVFWILLNTLPYFSSEDYKEKLDAVFPNDTVFTAITLFTYGVILLFIYLLYKSYQSISVTDNAKKLMESILKTRKIVKYYVLYNLIVAGVSLLIGFYFAFTKDPIVSEKLEHFNNNQLMLSCLIILGTVAGFVVIIWLFYRLLYGLLLKRLNRNYKELKKLEV
ncbi:hypothetical protein [Siansivirga zeaxanthinifaciens]|uniref:Beta-carotene 15,15'-monooxygenase n=1 Tax=Siansivirga zeaxanthinifaciens CC-SAMT-1 TaxID=1454006 RepID=A0A0C5WBX9_9FLAO|nr:hypothetical protein [Siansivirga zeaxanthinifaciens]AJR03767.1 hypothetical protein AW14_09205 [Siansivirga zeaxanthinifaciens CC-SAMT-1]